LARANDLVAEAIGDELIVYDGVTKQAHCLAPLAAAVFTASDGRTSLADLAVLVSATLDEPVDVPAVEAAVAELQANDLIVAPAIGGGLSRRDALRRGAAVGGVAFAAPLVASLATPAYGSASSLTSLSYVAMLFKVVSGGTTTYYRMKIGADGTTECGTSFATPACSLGSPAGTSPSGCLPGTVHVSQNTAVSPHQVTVSWTNTSATLVALDVKCANNCVSYSNPANSCNGGVCSVTETGCP
jgi:hypothetical protein